MLHKTNTPRKNILQQKKRLCYNNCLGRIRCPMGPVTARIANLIFHGNPPLPRQQVPCQTTWGLAALKTQLYSTGGLPNFVGRMPQMGKSDSQGERNVP